MLTIATNEEEKSSLINYKNAISKIETGRFLPPDLIITKYHNKPSEVYERLKKEGVADGYSKYSNDVKFGEEPIFTEGEDLREFIRRNNDRKRDAKNRRNNVKELHNGIRLEENKYQFPGVVDDVFT